MTKTLTLDGQWFVHEAGCEEQLPTIAPASVYQTLLENGKIEDPFFGANEEWALPISEKDFTFTRTFELGEDMLAADELLLVCDGLDTIADVYVNGQFVGHAENMHRTWEFDLSDAAKAGENAIEIRFGSPLKYIREAWQKSPYKGSEDAMRGFVHLRKAHCMFGWDWGIRLPDMGIWRSIHVVAHSGAKLEDVYVRQHHADGKVGLSIEANVAYLSDTDVRVETTVTAPDGATFSQTDADEGDLMIENPQLWWPNGYGDQPLYTVKVELKDASGDVLDVWQRRIGLRTMTMHREKDQWGESFAPEVNGVQMFAMGADYIPEDAILTRVKPETTRRLLEQAKEANFNSVRVWGGGHYPSDAFYDICDELGLMVWQDFMFACASYELTEAFEANIKAEFKDNVIRLRHHASLALWCGNNEMEMFAKEGNWVETPHQKSEYIQMYEYIIPKLLKQYDPDTFYWPASPSSGGSFDEPNDPNRGDVHYWMVWHGEKPFPEYRKFFFRYASEFGFQAYPPMATVNSFAKPEDQNAFSYVMEKHQRNASANGKIMKYISQMYLYPKDFPSLVYTSMILQADAIRYGVEHWRRNRGRCMGAIYWQLNDNWPVISWASVDYHGRWKALHYAAKKFFAPVLLSAKEEGELTGRPDVNIELSEPVKKTVQLSVANETRSEVSCKVRWTRRRADSTLIESGETDVTVPALTSVWLDDMEFADMDIRSEYVTYALEMDGQPVSFGTVLLVAPKHFHFVDPQLSARVEGDEIVVSAKAYAKAVMIEDAQGTLKLSDNFFDMDAGERRVKIIEGKTDGLSVRSVYDIDK
ncbi:MAG: glycoside hydrolase family 2 protein [Clostridia bacterium]|nr:glycoside hydrolase family 2 protein [Clostridia bacterium]